MDSIIRLISKMLDPIKRRVLLMVGRAVLTTITDSTKKQTLQIVALDGEVLDQVERFQNYGMTSRPLKGAEAVVVSVGGEREHPLVITVDDMRYRVRELQPGEVCIYTDEDENNNEHRITMKRGKEIEFRAGTSYIRMTPDEIMIYARDGQGTVWINE